MIVHFNGRIGKTPELRTGNNGSFYTFSVAEGGKDDVKWRNCTASNGQLKSLFERRDMKGASVSVTARVRDKEAGISFSVIDLSVILWPKKDTDNQNNFDDMPF